MKAGDKIKVIGGNLEHFAKHIGKTGVVDEMVAREETIQDDEDLAIVVIDGVVEKLAYALDELEVIT